MNLSDQYMHASSKVVHILGRPLNKTGTQGLMDPLGKVYIGALQGTDLAIKEAISKGIITEPGIFGARVGDSPSIRLFRVYQGGLEAQPQQV